MSETYPVDRSRLPKDVCEHLCTKHMFIAGEDREATEHEQSRDTATAGYWCDLTQTGFGPDEDQADPDTCRPGRSCCVPRFRIEV
jgi:hypothetical protein